MNDDNDHDVIRYTDVAADYAAARKLGAEPPDIPEQYLRHGNGFQFMHRWLVDHDMIGAHGRWLAEHGVALWCPDWCQRQDDHGPVQVVDTDADGACHDYIEHQVGNVTGVFSQFDGGDGGREQYVTITGTGEAGFDGQLMVPLAAIGDLIELLHTVPIPEGVE